MPWPQVWPRRQKVSQQWALTGPAPMKRVERTNIVMVHPNQRVGFALHNLYAMEMDRGSRNCYSCRGFGHLAQNCKKQIMGQERKMEYEDNWNNR